jgi:hypothetical protein
MLLINQSPSRLRALDLIFKSMEAQIGDHEAANRLIRFVPKSRLLARRRLYLGETARRKLDDPSSAVSVLVGRGKIEAALTRWTLGNQIYGDGKKARFLKRLEAPPPEVWEIRITEPNAQARLFGRFALPDTMILTDFHTRHLLGKRGSSQWKSACQGCVDQWNICSQTILLM